MNRDGALGASGAPADARPAADAGSASPPGPPRSPARARARTRRRSRKSRPRRIEPIADEPASLRRGAGTAKSRDRIEPGIDCMASTDTAPKTARPRPLSPHLEIYRFTLTMAMSIVHRITGVGLYVGVLLLAWFLIAASTDAASFSVFSGFIQSIPRPARAVRLHLGAVPSHARRHPPFHLGRRLRPRRSRRASSLRRRPLIGGIVLTLIVWIVGYVVR